MTKHVLKERMEKKSNTMFKKIKCIVIVFKGRWLGRSLSLAFSIEIEFSIP